MSESEPNQLKQLALNHAFKLLQRWYPNGIRRGDEFCVGNVAGSKGQSLKINFKTGVWADFNAANHKGGDLISLRALKDSVTYGEAARRISDEIGGDDRLGGHGTPVGQKAVTEATVPVPAGASEVDLPIGLQHLT